MATELTEQTNADKAQSAVKQMITGEKSDPTGNVLQLVDAAIHRVDDLRRAETRRSDDLREAETRRSDQQLNLRAEYDTKLREAESKRIDAIRAVDVNAVAVSAERSADQATVLASQVAASAETLRGLVATTAQATASQLQQITTQLTDRLASLEKAQYEGTGKQALQDPMMVQMVQEIKAMRETQFQKQGAGTGQKDMIGWIVAGVLFLIALFGFLEKMQK